MSDRGYFNLLSHLTRSSTSLSLSTFQASIAHYLAHVQPSSTPLAASVVSSPYFRPISYVKLEAISTAFRHAVHLKVKLLKDEQSTLFSRGLTGRTREWVRDVLRGLQGGNALLRLACTGGMLLGLNDLEREFFAPDTYMRRRVEEEIVVSLAEVMDMYCFATSGWEKEFVPTAQGTEGILPIAFLVASRSLHLVASHRLKTLPLSTLATLLVSTIESAFQSGAFLSSLSEAVSSDASTKTSIKSESSFAENLRGLTASPVISSMASLSAMCAQILSALSDLNSADAWTAISETMETLDALTTTLEADWLRSPLAALSDEESISPESQELASTMWTILKTLLFTTIRLAQTTLSIVAYTPSPPQTSKAEASPFSLSLTVLHIFSHLSFVLPQFGGVASTSEGGFLELKKVFYTALDILSSDASESSRFVHELHDSFIFNDGRSRVPSSSWPDRFLQAKKAYALACVEQLVPVLSDEGIRDDLYPLCELHLNDAGHRETFESAHSVMLAVFASHAQKSGVVRQDGALLQHRFAFAEQYVPSYVQCLIDNSADGKLNVTQLCLAYCALVRSAGSFGSTAIGQTASEPSEGEAYASFCIDALLHALRSDVRDEHRHRLSLALISAVPSVSLILLPHLLKEVLDVVIEAEDGRRQELVDALFEEIADRVGDDGKQYAMRWWHENKARLAGGGIGESGGMSVVEGKGKAQELVARL